MESNVGAWMLLKSLNKRQIAARVGLLKDMTEVAARLMRMNQ